MGVLCHVVLLRAAFPPLDYSLHRSSRPRICTTPRGGSNISIEVLSCAVSSGSDNGSPHKFQSMQLSATMYRLKSCQFFHRLQKGRFPTYVYLGQLTIQRMKRLLFPVHAMKILPWLFGSSNLPHQLDTITFCHDLGFRF